MQTPLDCIPCFMRQTLQAIRLRTHDIEVQEKMIREVLAFVAKMDFSDSPPAFAKTLHSYLKSVLGEEDIYSEVKERFNSIVLSMVPELFSRIESAEKPLLMAVKLAIAGNVIDVGPNGILTEDNIRSSVEEALNGPFEGDFAAFEQNLQKARKILFLADNAGEIVFDKLLIEQLMPCDITVVVRGGVVLNDATIHDAEMIGLKDLVEVVDNGDDAPGTILKNCSVEFRRKFNEADLIIAKGQGNFESLSDEEANIFFLFKVKCPVVARRAGSLTGTHVLKWSGV